MEIQLHLWKNLSRRRLRKKTPASGFNHEDDDKYRVEVKNKFQNIMEMGSEESIPNDIWEDVKQVVLDTAQKTIPKR